jgi:hypothetical protein
MAQDKDIKIKALEFVDDQELGWYWKAINEVYPLFDQIYTKIPNFSEKYPQIDSILKEVKETLYSSPDTFISEYKSLLPDISPSNIVFSHNDT